MHRVRVGMGRAGRKEALICWWICTLVHWSWNPCVSLSLEKAAFWTQSRKAIGFFSLKNEDYHPGIFFLCLRVFLLYLLDTNCISLSSNNWHQSWSHLSEAHGRSNEQDILLLIFFQSRYKEMISFHLNCKSYLQPRLITWWTFWTILFPCSDFLELLSGFKKKSNS